MLSRLFSTVIFLFVINQGFAQTGVENSVQASSLASLDEVHYQGASQYPQYMMADTIDTMSKLNKINASLEWYMKYFPIPFLSYSNETNWLFGISKFNAFQMSRGDEKDTITQPSSINAFGYFTFNNQYKAAVESNLMLNKNKALWETTIAYTKYPLE